MAGLEIESVDKRFGTVNAIDEVSLGVADGEFVCLLGPSGCGKSTLLRMVAGFETPGSGDIRIDGDSVLALPPNRRPTGMVFQSHALWPHMTVFGNIAFGLRLHGHSRAAARAKVAEALALVGLDGLERRYPAELSGGQQQRVAIARCLVLEPKILLMDEPFSALDTHLRVRLRDELHAIQRRLGLTTLFVTHDQEEALTLADRIAVMNAGRIEQVGHPADVYDRPRTAFVAAFIGTMNILEGEVRSGILAAGPIRHPAALDDGPCTLAIRAEDMVPADGPHAVIGVTRRVVDLGAFRMVQVDIGTPAPLKLRLGKAGRLAEGDRLSLRILQATLFREGREPAPLVASETALT